MSDRGKITDQHRRRRAVVYVRQSTLHQVERHVESAARQYALRERAVELGWPRESVVVVDEDTGRSGSSVEGRIDFKDLVAEVGLGQVGLVLALEVSRFALLGGLAPIAGSVRADWHADR
jgi:DNA invertase Pin-like site-specific DNA recombinase